MIWGLLRIDLEEDGSCAEYGYWSPTGSAEQHGTRGVIWKKITGHGIRTGSRSNEVETATRDSEMAHLLVRGNGRQYGKGFPYMCETKGSIPARMAFLHAKEWKRMNFLSV